MNWNRFGKTGEKTGKMLTNTEKNRYSRHILLSEIGEKGQRKLKEAKVLVIGAGGLGCPVLQYLTAAGIGTIGVIDDDVVERSNLQRQVLFSEKDIGVSKAKAAARRLRAMNSTIKIIPFHKKLTQDNALELFRDFDLIVEGSDSFSIKYLVNDAAVLTKKPLVLASIYKFEGQLSVFNFQNGPTYRCLFPEPLSPEKMPTCSEIGVLGVLPGVMGTLMANEVLKIILGLGEILSGKLLKLDLLTLEQQLFSFQKDKSIHIHQLEEIDFSCPSIFGESISYQTYLQNKAKYQLVDVRSIEERNQFHIGGLHLPLNQLENQLDKIRPYSSLVFYCASGARSQQAINLLQAHFPDKTYLNLKNGLSDILDTDQIETIKCRGK